GSLGRLEGTVKHRQVFVLDVGRAFDGTGSIDVADDFARLIVRAPELEQRRGHGLVDDFDHSAADQLFVLHQGEIGRHAGCVAVHHEADGAGGGENGDLGVSVSVLFAVGESFVPGLFAGFVQRSGDVVFVDVVDRGAVHADYV